MPAPKKPKQGLTAKQEMFCREYIKDLNASDAARRSGYSEKASRQVAYFMLKDPKIKAYVQKLMDERAKRVELSADMVLSNIKEIACSKEYGPDQKIRAADVLKANELLGKHLKIFTEKVEVEGKVTLERLVVESFDGEE